MIGSLGRGESANEIENIFWNLHTHNFFSHVISIYIGCTN